MAKLSLETRKSRLIAHIYYRLLEDDNLRTLEWGDALDAMQDVMHNSTEGMKEWTVTKDNFLVFR